MIHLLQQETTKSIERPVPVEFFEKAERLKHDRDKLLKGEEITTYFTVDSFEKGRFIACNATPQQLKNRLPGFFNPSLAARSRLGQGVHDRGEAIVFAGAALQEDDRDGFNRHFPMHVKGISVLHKTVKSGETWDISVRGEQWGLNEMEELYSIVNIGTLILEKGAKLVVRGNVFTLLCQHLICQGDDNDYHIAILPTPFSVDFGDGPHNGDSGADGSYGERGSDGTSVELRYGLLGAWIDEEKDFNTNATQGRNGDNGADGKRGRNGGMCKLAEITIRLPDGKLTVFSQAGTGGDGGNGGSGGHGGGGGNGIAGAAGFNKMIPGGRGGDGGNGGDGGKGGNAGHGGLASNIYLQIPAESIPDLLLIATDSMGGIAGKGGEPGMGGKAGEGGQAVDKVPAGENGRPGFAGHEGQQGIRGRSRPAAVFYVNNHIYNPIS